MNYIKNIKLDYLLLFTLVVLSVYDIGNLDALRQGTEGFYLLISNEMFQDGYFLTPRLVDGNHWSKPPFHFWLPMPIQIILQGSYLTSARLSILIFSFLSIFILGRSYKKYFNKDHILFILLFMSSFCFLKYSRIYMMEMPFALLTFISSFCYYLNYQHKSKNAYYFAILTGAFSVLVKGPVSLAIICGTITLFTFTDYLINKKLNIFDEIKRFSLWFISSLFLASLWFIYCYITYGNEFYEYFFIRENLGKFSAKNYPVSSLFNGLFLYTFPLIVFIPKAIKSFLSKRDSFSIYLIICFAVSFFIWFIPNQKSHHYAVPAIMPLIFFIFHHFNNNFLKGIERIFIALFCGFFLIIMFITSYLNQLLEIPYFEKSSLFYLIFVLIITTSSFFLLLRSKNEKVYFFSLSTFTTSIWVLFLPIFLLPTVPQEVIHLTKDKGVSVVFRKPYFIQEGLNKEIGIYSHDRIKKRIIDSGDLAIVPLDIYQSQGLGNTAKIIHQWPLWRRGIKPLEIIDAVRNEQTAKLVDYLVLLERR